MSNTINQTQANSIDQKYALLNAKNKNTDSTATFKTTTKWSGSTSNVDPSITKEVLNSLSKDYTNIEGLKPTDISFEDYEKMSYEALEVIFEGNGDFIGKASGLMATAQLTEDKILNKIFFDDFSKAQKEGTNSVITSYSIHYTKLYESALIKAPAIIISKVKLNASARNILEGTISEIKVGQVRNNFV